MGEAERAVHHEHHDLEAKEEKKATKEASHFGVLGGNDDMVCYYFTFSSNGVARFHAPPGCTTKRSIMHVLGECEGGFSTLWLNLSHAIKWSCFCIGLNYWSKCGRLVMVRYNRWNGGMVPFLIIVKRPGKDFDYSGPNTTWGRQKLTEDGRYRVKEDVEDLEHAADHAPKKPKKEKEEDKEPLLAEPAPVAEPAVAPVAAEEEKPSRETEQGVVEEGEKDQA